MKSRLTNEVDRGQRPLFLPQWLLPQAQQFDLAIIVLTFIQVGYVYTNPINSRANIMLSGSLGSSKEQQQPYNITTTARNSRSRNGSPDQTDTLGSEHSPHSSLNQQMVQPIGSSINQGNHFHIPLNNERVSTLPQSTSQNRESIERGPNRDYIVNRPSLNVTDKFQAPGAPPMYSPTDLISEGSGNGPLHSFKHRPDDTEDGDDDEDDYDDREMIENSPDPENNPGQQSNKKPTYSAGSTNWPEANNNPYVPFRGHISSNNLPVYREINETTQTTQQPSLRPPQTYSSYEQTDNNPNDHRFVSQVSPPKPFPVPSSAPFDRLDTLSANKNTPRYDNLTDTITDYSSKLNRTESHTPSSSLQVNKFDQKMTADSIPKSPSNNKTLADTNILSESNRTLLSDSKSKDQDVDYDYEEEMEEEDAEDNSAFEDGEPLSAERHDNKTNESFPQFHDENQHSNNDSYSFAKNTPHKINDLPITTISTTTKSPVRLSSATVEPSPARESSTTHNPLQSGSDTSEGQDYVDEEDDEDPEDEEDDLNIEDDDLDNEDDLAPDSMKDYATNSPPIQIFPPTANAATPVPGIANSNQKVPNNDPFGIHRTQLTPPNERYNFIGPSTESSREPEVLRELPSGTPPFAMRTTTVPPGSYLSSETQPTTTTTITSLLTLKPTSSPPTTRTPSSTNWYTTPKSVDAIPSSGSNPPIVNYGSGSLEDDAGLTKQIYDKAVEVYQTVHKAVVSAVEAVSQPNIDWSSSSFEPLLSQPLFFMCKYEKFLENLSADIRKVLTLFFVRSNAYSGPGWYHNRLGADYDADCLYCQLSNTAQR